MLSLIAMLSGCASASARSCRADAAAGAALQQLQGAADSLVVRLAQAADSDTTSLRRSLQAVVDRVAQLDACKTLTSAESLRSAGTLALTAQTLGQPTVEHAYRWARRAVVLDSADRRNWRVMAHSWDQLQVLQRQPQWFGTVISCDAGVAGRCVIAPIDSTRVSDPQRVELGLRTLVQQRATVDSMNRLRTQP